jgi:hypothetical protein
MISQKTGDSRSRQVEKSWFVYSFIQNNVTLHD